MNSIILVTTARILSPLLLVFSLFVLFRGHHEPGGGFAGGLLAAAAFSLRPLRRDVHSSPSRFRVAPQTLIGTGLLVALGSGVPSMLLGRPFMTGLWGSVSTVLLFDIGVYLTVMGIVLLKVYTLAEE